MQIFQGEYEFLGSENDKIAGSVFSCHKELNEAFKQAKHSPKPPILLLHGGGQTRHSWQRSAEQFAQENLAITYDSRGHGESDWVQSKAYSFINFAEDTVKVAQAITDKTGHKPIAIGASLGGISALIAQYQAQQELLSALILVDITPRMSFSGVSKILGFMSEKVKDGFQDIEEAAEAIAQYLPNRKREKNLNSLQKNLRQANNGRWYWHWDPQFLEVCIGDKEDQSEWLNMGLKAVEALKIPTLLVRGSNSELIEKHHVEEFLSLAPHAKYVDVNDAGHMVAGDKNDVFFESIAKFLKTENLA